jgi:hypothetical protein
VYDQTPSLYEIKIAQEVACGQANFSNKIRLKRSVLFNPLLATGHNSHTIVPICNRERCSGKVTCRRVW